MFHRCFTDLQWLGSFMLHNIGKCIRNFEYIFKTTVLMLSLHIQVLCALYMRHRKPTNDIGNSSEYERFIAPEKSSSFTKDWIFNPQSKHFLLRIYYNMYNFFSGAKVPFKIPIGKIPYTPLNNIIWGIKIGQTQPKKSL